MIPRTFPTDPITGYWTVFEIDPTGKKKWVDYIPVEDIGGSATSQNRYDDDKGYKVEVLVDVTGLVAWVDYTPVDFTTGTNWRSDDGGVIPVFTP